MANAFNVIRGQLPQWWRDINQRTTMQPDEPGVMGSYYGGPRATTYSPQPNPEVTPSDLAQGAFDYTLGLPASLLTYSGDAQAKAGGAAAGAVGKVGNALSKYAARKAGSTVRDPLRVAYPGIYDNPREIIQSQNVAPESPLLQQLWGVSPETMRDMYLAGERQIGRIDPRVLGALGLGAAGYTGGKYIVNKVNNLKTEREDRMRAAERRAQGEDSSQ